MVPGGGVCLRPAVVEGRLEVLHVYKLLQLVREGDKPQIEKLIHLGVPNLINLTEPAEGKGAMHQAAVTNDLDMVQFLLNLEANPDVQDKRGRTAVILAAELGYDGMVALLAKNHANMNMVDNEGKGVLFYCISPTKRHAHCLQVALNHKANVNNISSAGQPVFLLACEHADKCESMCLSILEMGADPNATHQATGRTALMEAARFGAVGLVRAILQRGGNPNAIDKKRQHAAHLAAHGGYFEVIQVLSAYSADFSVVNLNGDTPLHLAAAGGYADCCRFLAQRGCNPKLKNLDGLFPRQIAKNSGHKAALKELKKAEQLHTKFSKAGADNPNALWALTLHDWSCEHENILRKAFANAVEADGSVESISRDAFMSVLQEHHAPIDHDNLQKIIMDHDNKREGVININDFFKGLKYLQKAFVLSSYAPKKKKSGKGGKGKKKGKYVLPLPICTVPPEMMPRREDGGPPNFMIESYQQYTDTKRFSRDCPPNHPVEDDSAWYLEEPEKIYTNINYCVKTGDFESLCLAFSQQVPVDVKDRFYKTPLMTACSNGSYQMAKFLIMLGADVNACDQFNWTPLHHACHAGQVDIIDLLVQSGAMVDTVALNGATPLMRAIESCRISCVDYLIKAGAAVQAENKKEQNCLDIARAYGDERIIDMVKMKLDSLPKCQDSKEGKGRNGGKGGTGGKPPPNPKPVAPIAVMKVAPALPDTVEKKVDLKENIITMNPYGTFTASTNKLDIRFAPRTVWGKRLATSAQHMERKVDRRKRLTHEVDFKDFIMPFNKNIMQKTLELT
ncbi:ankyrin repeat and EF-hand domain-containing protein 1 [Salminus brasiliensis]|uniref:ankyrin repeat and EF-hand domain-containing protein 1 n=1 Tax=Salminus brasiliensis TaxID=930266 RepID=UPI003B834795